ncbi:adenosine receptor A2a-like [Bolinopsis microptera]|uniref:adenosine receptor A2a-like n=1 Tax=Bolinopsis microptera TaxID=2820187 RepID=UPI00307AD55A
MAGNETVEFRHTQNNRIAMGCMLGLICIITIIGNCLVLLAISTCRHLRSISNLFIWNLALVDFIIGICTMPITVLDMENLEQQIIECFTLSLWTLAASAVDRCFAILRPFKYNRLMNKNKARCMLGAVWLLSLGLALCPVIGWDSYVYSWFSFSCGINPAAQGRDRYFFLFYTLLALIMPLVVVVACYIPIYIVSRRANKIHASQTQPGHSKRQMQAAFLVIIIVSVFTLTTLPIMTVGMLNWLRVIDSIPLLAAIVFHIMLYSNSALNPILYGVFNTSFRRMFSLKRTSSKEQNRRSVLTLPIQEESRPPSTNGSML